MLMTNELVYTLLLTLLQQIEIEIEIAKYTLGSNWGSLIDPEFIISTQIYEIQYLMIIIFAFTFFNN